MLTALLVTLMCLNESTLGMRYEQRLWEPANGMIFRRSESRGRCEFGQGGNTSLSLFDVSTTKMRSRQRGARFNQGYLAYRSRLSISDSAKPFFSALTYLRIIFATFL